MQISFVGFQPVQSSEHMAVSNQFIHDNDTDFLCIDSLPSPPPPPLPPRANPLLEFLSASFSYPLFLALPAFLFVCL